MYGESRCPVHLLVLVLLDDYAGALGSVSDVVIDRWPAGIQGIALP